MQIINGAYPPNIDEIRKYLPVHDKVVFCWGGRLFNPKSLKIDPALMKHEMKHSEQQAKFGTQKHSKIWLNLLLPSHRIREWWKRYLREAPFRLAMEIPAYQAQFREYKKVIKDRNQLNNLALALARDLSSPLYGKLLSTEQALKAIKSDKIYEFNV